MCLYYCLHSFYLYLLFHCRYCLKPPNNLTISGYIDNIVQQLLHHDLDRDMIIDTFIEKFKDLVKDIPPTEIFTTACQLIGKRLVYDNLALRKQLVGEFFHTIRAIQQLLLDDSTFECGFHTKSIEPYFIEMAYKVSAASPLTVIDRDNRCLVTNKNVLMDGNNEVDLTTVIIAVDTNGTCHVSLDDDCDVLDQITSWKCNIICKQFTDDQKKIVVELKNSFDNSVGVIRSLLEHVDGGCRHPYYFKSYVESSDEACCFKVKGLMGHPMHCAFESCDSQLHLLCAGAVHYPALRTLLNSVYRVKRSSRFISKIESDLSAVHSIESLKKNLKITDLVTLLEYDELPSSTTYNCTTLSISEAHLEVKFATIIKEFKDKLKEDAEYYCCSCERLLFKKNLTHLTLQLKSLRVMHGLGSKLTCLKRIPMSPKRHYMFVSIADLF